MSRKILITAYHYPPVRGSSGIQRTLKFSKYLRDFGWEPMILTVHPRAYEQVSDDQMGEIPEGILIERAFALNTARHLSIRGKHVGWMAQPDRWVSWWPAAVMRGMQMIRRHRPEVIMSTFPIATAHLIGLTLRRLSGLPWVADCRDSMTEENYPVDPLTWRMNRKLESATVKHSTKTLFTTAGARDMYAERYPHISSSRWGVIENGFDEENFLDAERNLSLTPQDGSRRITLVHSGILYSEERDPRPFFAALQSLKASGDIDASTVRVVLRATGNDGLYRDMLKENGIADLVELAPAIGYREALREMIQADGLLLFQAANCNHQIPAKLYEYFRAGRPIFALTDSRGNTAESLRNAGGATIVNLADWREIADGLKSYLAQLKQSSATGTPPDVAALHSRRSRTAELAKVLNEVAGRI